jgi:hypothetical protein
MDITITLDLQEVNGMLNLLGKLPTETNIWPLCAKIRSQAEQQVQPLADAQQEPAGLTE